MEGISWCSHSKVHPTSNAMNAVRASAGCILRRMIDPRTRASLEEPGKHEKASRGPRKRHRHDGAAIDRVLHLMVGRLRLAPWRASLPLASFVPYDSSAPTDCCTSITECLKSNTWLSVSHAAT